jgi:hypothetical protein
MIPRFLRFHSHQPIASVSGRIVRLVPVSGTCSTVASSHDGSVHAWNQRSMFRSHTAPSSHVDVARMIAP